MDNGPLAPTIGEIPGITDLRAIGRGGFATVYRGWQAAFRRPVAVKLFDERPGMPALVRFRKESEAMGSLSSHPNVVGLYDAGILGGRPYLVMPYLSGGSLQDRLEVRPLPPAEVARVGAAIAGALSSAHAIGLLHRDVKPANILYTAYGEPQLADFGIARFADSTLTNGGVAATVSYAAPEVLQGGRAGPPADVYALGATLYAALTGGPPFEAIPDESLVGFAMRTIREQPADLRRRGVPASLARVIERAMAKQPARRQASAQELRQELLAVASALPRASMAPRRVMRQEVVRPAPPPDRPPAAAPPGPSLPAPTVVAGPRTPSRRRPLLIGLVAILAVLAAAVVGMTVFASPPQHRRLASPDFPKRPSTSGSTLGRAQPAKPGTSRRTTASTATHAPGRSTGASAAGNTTRPSNPVTKGQHSSAGSQTTPARTTATPTIAAPASGASTTAPPTTTTPRTTTPATTPRPSSTQPAPSPSGGPGAVNGPPPAVSAGTVGAYVGRYYSMVNAGDLSSSWRWLSPAFQRRLGWSYYQSFWHSIADVQIESVEWAGNGADMTLRYQEANGTVSVEHVAITFTTSEGQALIDSYRVG